ncbi:hypothetical protein Q9Q94_04045 [Uliginosibacterium sp. 31-16]|uniref:hypothetical protein n=1 Tax=Uliginosibacterium sp. 31-16 TaxID=3068315 RepID=UPI00273D0C97|nr:hypothetical protein [Uliginosibacterium sp. 31-16]MDP5238684.1 hypothetical protein [Uliginosibacterium sp. 31-16]
MRDESPGESDPDTEAEDWRPVSGIEIGFVLLLLAYVLWQHFLTEDRWVFLLDNANLAIHEAGHPLIGLLSERLMVYGGTLFQLAFPLAFALHFRRQRHATGWAVSLAWFGENLLNVGRYMADARAQLLPLVGGEHDWTEIWGRWGLLARDTSLGGFTRLIGLAVMVWAAFWLWRRWCSAQD